MKMIRPLLRREILRIRQMLRMAGNRSLLKMRIRPASRRKRKPLSQNKKLLRSAGLPRPQPLL
ncbi:MAG: hypothetical protein JRI96_14395 [Deltaproteobacteria bacterium]|nr:hypothetical protein [Deltaproteobacteria bacterium]